MANRPEKRPYIAHVNKARYVFAVASLAIALTMVVRVFGIETRTVASSSMALTLLEGDWLVIQRFGFGVRVPYTRSKVLAFSEAKRGKVVAFDLDESSSSNDVAASEGAILVKRVVGVAGDTLLMRNRILYVNGIEEAGDYMPALRRAGAQDQVSRSFAWQKPAELHGTRFGEPADEPTRDTWGPLVVPPRCLFVLGDNRNMSRDSRFFGFVPSTDVRGQAVLVYLSLDPSAPAFQRKIRWTRMGRSVR